MNKKAQVWVETVIYTLIAFVLIGAVLAFVKPKIEEMQDNAIIEQSLGMLKEIDAIIFSVKGTSGNVRIVDVIIKKGSLTIDSENNKLIFEIDSRKEYSQPGETIQKDNIAILTEKKGEYNKITLEISYSGKYDIRFDENTKGEKILNKAPTPYKLSIGNLGVDENNIPIINFEVK